MAEDKIIPEAATGAFDEKELNIINAIEQDNTLLPSNLQRPIRYDSGFMSDVVDEWNLSWIGQMMEQKDYDMGWMGMPIDQSYDPYLPENIEGYEQFASKFTEVRNKGHHDFLKAKIDKNMARRNRLDSSERGILPALVAGLGDPINYIPIPFVKGLTFAGRAVKGGAVASGLVGATEPIRRSLDPTSSNAETGMYLGGSFILGGLFTGFLGKSGAKIARETIGKKGGTKKIGEKVFEAHAFNDGRKDFEATGFNYNVGDDVGNVRVVYNKNPKNKLVSITGKADKKTMSVDYVRIRNIFQNSKHLVSKIRGVAPLPKKFFKSADDYMQFLMKKEVLRTVYGKSAFKRLKDEPLASYENRLNNAAYRELTEFNKADLSTQANGFFKWVESWTNYGSVINKKKLKDHYYAEQMMRLSGDYGTKSRAAKDGYTFGGSALLEAQTYWIPKMGEALKGMSDDFVEFRTGQANSKKILDMNINKGGIRFGDAVRDAKDKVLRRNTRQPNEITFDEYKREIFMGVVDDRVYSKLNKVQKKSVDRVRKFFADYEVELREQGMFASQQSYARRMKILEGQIAKFKEARATAKFNKAQLDELDVLIRQSEKEFRYIKDDLIPALNRDEPISPPFEMGRNYVLRMYRTDKMYEDKDEFIKILADHFLENPIVVKRGKEFMTDTSLEARMKRAEDVYNKIMDEDAVDADGLFGIGRQKDGSIKAGVRPLMSRSLNIPTWKIAKFVENDIEFLMRQYQIKVSNALEISKKFGDHHMAAELKEMHFRLIRDEMKTAKDKTKINQVLNAFEDEKDKMLGSISLEDPSSVSKRTAAFLRDWASLAFMGKVVFSAVVDAARPIMVNGAARTFKNVIKHQIGNPSVNKAVENLKYMGVAPDVVLGSARKRIIEDGGYVGRGKSFIGRKFDKVADMFNNAQAPFYFVNGLTPWTQMMKEHSGLVSAHRFIEDSNKWAKGTLDDFGKERLISYGIDEKTAKLIASMPYEDLDGLFTANVRQWGTKTGGTVAARKFRQAVHADVSRTIITPQVTDQFNMMHGVLRVNNEDTAKFLDNGFFRMFGYQKTERGGKFSNAYIGLPFQFFSWAVAANRKLVISGLSGREQDAISGVFAMICMGMFGDYLKNPRYWSQKPWEEKIIRGVELSGVAGLFTDMNFITETISGGMFDHAVGIRPALGLDLRFGNPDMADAIGEFTGAGPSIIADLIYAFGTDADFDDKAATIRRIIPLNTLWIWDRTFKDLYNFGVDELVR